MFHKETIKFPISFHFHTDTQHHTMRQTARNECEQQQQQRKNESPKSMSKILHNEMEILFFVSFWQPS